MLNELCFVLSEETLLRSLVGEVDDEEPGDETNELRNQALDNLRNC